MARASQNTQQRVGYKLAPNLTAPTADGDIIDAGDVRLWVRNDSGGSINVTAQSTGTVEGLNVEDLVVAVAAGTDALIGPFPKTVFARTADPDKGRVYIDYSAVAGITRGVVDS